MKLFTIQQVLLLVTLFVIGACSMGLTKQGSNRYSKWSKDRQVKHIQNVLARHDQY